MEPAERAAAPAPFVGRAGRLQHRIAIQRTKCIERAPAFDLLEQRRRIPFRGEFTALHRGDGRGRAEAEQRGVARRCGLREALCIVLVHLFLLRRLSGNPIPAPPARR
ncbi:hypothetical protein WK62_05875 [Burkholderia ubonensis]|nr:hypothetical protein WK62_05875 [Burkholderia ubonensis]